jgi:hypothetical protein
LSIHVDVSDPHLAGSWVYGAVVLHKSAGGQAASDTVLPLAVYASPGVAPAFQEVGTSGPGGSATLAIGGLVALPEPRYTATALAPATTTTMSLGVDPKPDQLYGNFTGAGKQFVLFTNPTQQGPDFTVQAYLFIVEVTASDAPITNLYAGIDSNGDGTPKFAEQSCQASAKAGSGTVARCVVDLAAAGNAAVWALVDIPQGAIGATYHVTLSSGIPTIRSMPPNGSANDVGVFGPGHVPAGITFPLRLFFGTTNGLTPLLPNTRYYGAVLIDAVADGTRLGQVAKLPFALTRAAGTDDVLDALQPNAARTLVLEAGESLTHQFIDVPGNGVLTVTTSRISGSSVAFSAVRADFPPFTVAPGVVPAPIPGSGAARWTLDATTPSQTVTVPVTAGRWYLVATNGGGDEAQFLETLRLSLADSSAPPVPGAYYNPQRSGHGVFLSQSNDQQAVYWYTYLADGTPVWYVALGPRPTAASGAWSAPLYRVTWDGTTANAHVIVGDVILTPIDASSFMFSWHLAGTGGSERFTLLAPNACVAFPGGQADFTGQWYAPAQSGYGMDVVALPGDAQQSSQQIAAFYFYDAVGEPRWALGGTAPFAPSSTMSLNQFQGFCPTCTYTATTSQPIGTLIVDYASAMTGRYRTNLALLPPLGGSWIIDQPIVRLTGSPSCP